MESFESIIQSYLDNKDVFLVFPSDVAARYISRKILRTSVRRVIPQERFLIWDRFKERVLVYQTSRRPVNSYIRALFSARFLHTNSTAPFLEELVSPNFVSHSTNLINVIKQNLPLLHRVHDLVKKRKKTISSKKIADIQALYGSYQQFLAENNLFEPLYEEPVFSDDGNSYVIFFPEIILDFNSVLPVLQNQNSISFVGIDRFTGQKNLITGYDNTSQEIRQMMNTIHHLLNNGIHYDEIVITVARHDFFLPYLEREAYCLDIPLNVHIGTPLISLPGVSFFKQIERVVSSGFACDELKRLVYNKSMSWQNRDVLEKLVRFGISYHCVRNYHDGNRFIDIWEYNFKKILKVNDQYKELSGQYVLLRNMMQNIVLAGNFSDLLDAVEKYISVIVDRSACAETVKNNLRLAVTILQEYQRQYNRLSSCEVFSPFSLWMSMLQEKMYVPQFTTPGIAVYPYRVSAGINAACHFVVNADAAGTMLNTSNYPLLSPAESASIPNAETNFADDYLRLYLSIGDHVMISYARTTYTSAALPPAFFIEQGHIQNMHMPVDGAGRTLTEIEKEVWSSLQNKNTDSVFSIQKTGLEYAADTVFSVNTADYTEAPILHDQAARRIKGLLFHEDEIISISFTDFELYYNCPFRYFLKKLLQLDPMEWMINMFDNRWYGILVHRIFHRFFSEYEENNSPYPGRDRQFLTRHLEDIIEKVLNSWAFLDSIPPLPVWEYIVKKIVEGFQSFLHTEIETQKEYTILGSEKKYETELIQKRVIVHGVLDLVFEDETGIGIIDFKTKNAPEKKAFGLPDISPEACQIPFYTMLLEQTGVSVSSASYYSFLNKKYIEVLSRLKKAEKDRALLDTAIVFVKDAVREMAERLYSCDFSIKKEKEPGCRFCTFRFVCRNKYYIKN
ncbi:MAG: PD-(D/E)XK nuclease family protein [Spirochaetales bacterium]|nr:PD-(D/E)XK nuclease family protein [Spirochaetales bacterium]